MAYEVICSTFLLHQLNKTYTIDKAEDALDKILQCKKEDTVKRLKVYSRRKQLFLLLTSPAGAGKGTAIKATD